MKVTGSQREAGGAEKELAEQREGGVQIKGCTLSGGNGDKVGV